jgi:hypothetical protein
MKFYVYELLDDNQLVFYVGKGSGRRMWSHVYKARAGEITPRAEYIRKVLSRGGLVTGRKVFHTDDEQEAFAYEKNLISEHGRPPLLNQNSGGGHANDLSFQARQKIAKSRTGVKASDETKQKQRDAKLGTHRTEATKKKISKTLQGRPAPWARLPRTAAYREKMSKLKKGKPMPVGTGANISKAKMGHDVSEDTRRKISISKRKRAREARQNYDLFDL